MLILTEHLVFMNSVPKDEIQWIAPLTVDQLTCTRLLKFPHQNTAVLGPSVIVIDFYHSYWGLETQGKAWLVLVKDSPIALQEVASSLDLCELREGLSKVFGIHNRTRASWMPDSNKLISL